MGKGPGADNRSIVCVREIQRPGQVCLMEVPIDILASADRQHLGGYINTIDNHCWRQIRLRWRASATKPVPAPHPTGACLTGWHGEQRCPQCAVDTGNPVPLQNRCHRLQPRPGTAPGCHRGFLPRRRHPDRDFLSVIHSCPCFTSDSWEHLTRGLRQSMRGTRRPAPTLALF